MAKSKTKKEKSDYWKHPEYGMVFGPKLVTPLARLSWPSLVKPKEWKGKIEEGKPKPKPRYEATFLFKKDDAKVKLFFETEIETHKEAMVKLFNEGAKAKIMVDSCAKDGDKDFDFEEWPSLECYKGHWVLSARNEQLPNFYGINKDEKGDLENIEPKFFQGGMLVRAVISPLVTASGGLTYKLLDIQFVRDDGTRYGGAIKEGVDLLAESEEDLLEDLPELKAVETENTPDGDALAKAVKNVL